MIFVWVTEFILCREIEIDVLQSGDQNWLALSVGVEINLLFCARDRDLLGFSVEVEIKWVIVRAVEINFVLVSTPQ